MKKRYLIIALLFLNAYVFYGQNKTTEIRNIDKIIAITNEDSLMENVVAYTNLDSLKNPHPLLKVFRKDNKILKLSFCSNCSGINPTLTRREGGVFIDYYLDHEELCFVKYQDQDNSRPGSCGYVTTTYTFYFKNDKLLNSKKTGVNPCRPIRKSADDRLAESQLRDFKTLFEIAKDQNLDH